MKKIIERMLISALLLSAGGWFVATASDSGQDNFATKSYYKIKDYADKIIASAVSSRSIALKALENAFNFKSARENELMDAMSRVNVDLIKNNNKKTDLANEQIRTTRYMVEEIVLLSAEITNALLPIVAMSGPDISRMSEKDIAEKEKELKKAEKKLEKIRKITESLKKDWLIPFNVINDEAADK